MKKANPLSKEEPKKKSPSSGLSGDELDQVRDLLFGGTIREIEREREALKQDVSIGFAEADQMTNRRLDDVMRRLDALNQALTRDREERKNDVGVGSQKMDKALVNFASEHSAVMAKEYERIEQARMAESQRIEQFMAQESRRFEQARFEESQRVDRLIAKESARIDQAIEAEKKRIDAALDALHRQLDVDKMRQIDSLRRSVSSERVRLSKSIRALADGINKEQTD